MGHFTRNIERKILRVDDFLLSSNELLAVVHDKDTADEQLDVVLLLAFLKQIERSTALDEEESAELGLAFNREIFYTRPYHQLIRQCHVNMRNT
jgi:hypothetical protein